ncbi:MAG: hypothetical protein Q9227_006147 [Pyrenula ochraceoflavens]
MERAYSFHRADRIYNSYQPGGSSGFNPGSGIDPLSDADVCLRDATLMQKLGVNTIRVYNLDPTINHNDCASIFNAAGIYMILDVNSPLPNQSLNRGSPWESYNTDYLNRIFAVVEAFKSFPNTLGFFSGNEVINEQSVQEVPSYIRAVTRDLKQYISKHVDRPIPVGYSAADVREILGDTWSYLSCGLDSDPDSKIDFFGLNSYSWCGDSSFTTSGYDTLVAQFSNTTIPVFFSEYGCNKVEPRPFTEVPVLYGPQMTVLSGGLVYEYSQEDSDYGLVVLNDNNTVSLMQDYDNLQGQYNKLNVTLLESGNATATSLTPPKCDSSLITTQGFSSNFSVPSQPDGASDVINSGISKPPVGKMNPVSNTQVKQTVYKPDGSTLSGLQLNKLSNDQSNTPNSNDSGTGSSASGTASGTASGASPSATQKGAAVKVSGSFSIVVAALAVLAGVMASL